METNTMARLTGLAYFGLLITGSLGYMVIREKRQAGTLVLPV
jgi:hypothetical protein